LGSSTYRWRDGYFAGTINIETSGTSFPTDKIRLGNPGSGNQVGVFFEDPTANTYGARIYFDDSSNTFRVVTIQNLTEVLGIVIDRITGNVGIGTTTTTNKLNVSGDASITGFGDLGSLRIGGTEVITSGRVLQNITSVAQTLIPSSDNTYDLGSSSYFWRDVYIKNRLYIGGTDVSLYRSAVDILKTDDIFDVGKFLAVRGGFLAHDVFKTGPLGTSPDYIYINTRIPFVQGRPMLLIIRRFGYGQPDSLIFLSWYVYGSPPRFVNYKYDVLGGWKPSRIRLGTYTVDSTKYVRIEIANDGHYWTSYEISAYAHNAFNLEWFKDWSYSTGEFPADTEDIVTVPLKGHRYIGSGYKLYFEPDVNLYRSAENVLKTDDSFDTLALRIGGTEVITSGRVLQNIASIAQSLLPDADNNRDLGSSSYKWRNLYLAGALYLDSIRSEVRFNPAYEDIYFRIISSPSAGNTGGLQLDQNSTYAFRFYSQGTGSSSGRLEVWRYNRSTATREERILYLTLGGDLYIGRHLRPMSDNVNDLGSSTLRWRNVYGVNFYVDGSLYITKDVGWVF